MRVNWSLSNKTINEICHSERERRISQIVTYQPTEILRHFVPQNGTKPYSSR